MELNDYQFEALQTDQMVAGSDSALIVPLLGLAGEVGELLSEYKKHLRDGEAYQMFQSRIEEEIGDILWYVATVASRFDLSLDAVAAANLSKCRFNWIREADSPSVAGRFDAEFPAGERFPGDFVISFEEVQGDDGVRVRATWRDAQMGQTLTDNAYEDDGYRFHDVFHLACAAGLGWSPVSRRNLQLKRKSNPTVDEVEDGGRAIVIEEGVTALVFSYAVEHSWLEGVNRVDHDVLSMIRKMTAHLEVSRCTIAEWERTILMAYPVWKRVVDQRGGDVKVDLEHRSISFLGPVRH